MPDTTQTPDPLAEFLERARDETRGARGLAAGWYGTRLLAAVERVLKLHVPIDRGRVMYCCRGCEEDGGGFHEDCCHEWPCPTREAIQSELLGESGG